MENRSIETRELTLPVVVITPEDLLEHWQGHRRVTRRLIEVFSEEQFFTYSIGGMRPFSELITEILGMAALGIQGIVTGHWETVSDFDKYAPKTKAEVLHIWDEVTDQINKLWPQIPPQRFQERELAFGQYEGPVYSTLFYFIDNEIHHRGQGYVYLRSLGIQPPAFWDRD